MVTSKIRSQVSQRISLIVKYLKSLENKHHPILQERVIVNERCPSLHTYITVFVMALVTALNLMHVLKYVLGHYSHFALLRINQKD